MASKVPQDLLSSLLSPHPTLWQTFPPFSWDMLLPQGLCTSAAGSSAWHLHVLFPPVKGLIRNAFPDCSSSYSTPNTPLSHHFFPFYDIFFPYENQNNNKPKNKQKNQQPAPGILALSFTTKPQDFE